MSSIINLPVNRIVRSEGSWPSIDGALDEMTRHRISSEREFLCQNETQAILLLGSVFQVKDVLIQRCSIERTSQGFLIKAVTFNAEELDGSVRHLWYEERDLLEIFSNWTEGFSVEVYCQDSGEIALVQRGEFPWVSVDWDKRNEEKRIKYGLPPKK